MFSPDIFTNNIYLNSELDLKKSRSGGNCTAYASLLSLAKIPASISEELNVVSL